MNETHPERNTDVVIFLDTFAEARDGASGTLDLAVEAAGSLAAHYLREKDRVGLVAFGGVLNWLTVSSGIVQLYRVLDSLLDAEIFLSYAWKDIDILPVRTLPPHALVLALTPLLDERSRARAARPARPRLRPRGDRDLAGAVRRSREPASSTTSPTGSGCCGGKRCGPRTCASACRSSSGGGGCRCRPRSRR